MKSGALEASSSYIYEPRNETGSPERLLLLAVLERAILDFVGNDSREAQEAHEWIFEDLEEGAPEPFTFVWVCKELDLAPQAVAGMIKDMPKRGEHRIAPWYFARNQTDNGPKPVISA